MRVYLIDDLQTGHVEKIKSTLKQKKLYSPIEDVFHLPLPLELLDAKQQEHAAACAPYYLSLETGSTWIRLELLVRSASTLRCACVKYVSRAQREYGINTLDTLLQHLNIPA